MSTFLIERFLVVGPLGVV